MSLIRVAGLTLGLTDAGVVPRQTSEKSFGDTGCEGVADEGGFCLGPGVDVILKRDSEICRAARGIHGLELFGHEMSLCGQSAGDLRRLSGDFRTPIEDLFDSSPRRLITAGPKQGNDEGDEQGGMEFHTDWRLGFLAGGVGSGLGVRPQSPS